MGRLPRALWFDGQLRRRGRQVGRLGASSLTPSMYPSAPLARAFWFDGIANFGDALTPWLLRRAGVMPMHSSVARADLVGVGSILEMLPDDFAGSVWGSGLLHGKPLDLPNARFLAVRGELTRDLVRAPDDVALGDPGILVSRFLKRPAVRWQLGVVPHHMHENDPLWRNVVASSDQRVRIIDVRRGPSAVLRDIARSAVIVSTSLHGLVTADAYGIPAVWSRMEPDLRGGRFKFDDYESVVTPGRSRFVELSGKADLCSAVRHAQALDSSRVTTMQDRLLKALREANFPQINPATSLIQLRGRG